MIFIFLIAFGCAYKAPPPGKPDFDPPEIKVLNLKDKDTIRDTLKVEVKVEDKSKILWVKMIVNGEEFAVDTLKPYEFFIPPPDTIWKLMFKAMDEWENLGSSKLFKIFGPFVDTMKTDTSEIKK